MQVIFYDFNMNSLISYSILDIFTFITNGAFILKNPFSQKLRFVDAKSE